jgi:hypothetical protein
MSSDNDWLHSLAAPRSREPQVDVMANRMRRQFQINSDADDDSLSDSSGEGVIVAAPMDTGEEKIMGQWEYEPFDDEPWHLIMEEDTDDPDYCYLCAVTQTEKELEGNPALNNFKSYLVENYSKMTRMKLAIQGQSIYNQALRKYTRQKKPMRCKVIIDHLEKHAPTARIQLEHQVRMLQCCSMELSGQLKQRDLGSKEKTKTRMDKANLREYIKVTVQLNSVTAALSKMKPDAKK